MYCWLCIVGFVLLVVGLSISAFFRTPWNEWGKDQDTERKDPQEEEKDPFKHFRK